MFELRDVVGRCLHPEDASELVVHLDGRITQMMIYPCSLNAGVEIDYPCRPDSCCEACGLERSRYSTVSRSGWRFERSDRTRRECLLAF